MGIIQESNNVLRRAELSLRSLIERGVKEHRYAEVAEVASITESLTRLLRPESPAKQLGNARSPTSDQAVGIVRESKKTRPRALKDKYPRFERDGNKLVKVGWSKKKKEQYEHRAPQEAVLGFARHLESRVQEGEVFSIEGILPVSDPAGGEMPEYQVYLTLAWLRQEGAVERKGRDGYVLRLRSVVNGELGTLWTRLPVRTA